MTEFEKWKAKNVFDASGQQDAKDTWLAAMRVAYDFTLRCDRRPEDAILQEIEGLTKREDGE